MLFYCVRHGETQFNADGRIQGQTDSPLSDLGRRQCEAVAAALESRLLEAVYSSPLRRAIDSAECVAARLKLEIRIDPRLMEIDAGIFQGLTWPEIERRHPVEAKQWLARDPDYRIPQGESRGDVMVRARAAFEELRASGHRQVVVMAHGGLLSAAFRTLLEIPPRRNPFSLENASISRLAWDEEVKLISLNETGHLAGLRTAGIDL